MDDPMSVQKREIDVSQRRQRRKEERRREKSVSNEQLIEACVKVMKDQAKSPCEVSQKKREKGEDKPSCCCSLRDGDRRRFIHDLKDEKIPWLNTNK